MDLRDNVKQILRMCGHAVVSTVHERLERMEERANHVDASLLQASIHTIETLHNMTDAIVVPTRDRRVYDPEVGLAEFLYSYLPSRNVLDIGANTGDISAALLDGGFEVYAFEPDEVKFQRLEDNLKLRAGFHSFRIRVGDLAEEVRPAETYAAARHYNSPVSRGAERIGSLPDRVAHESDARGELQDDLDHLHRAGLIPGDIGLVWIRAGDSDLDVIRGMHDRAYPLVIAAFGGPKGSADKPVSSPLDTLVQEMRSRGYSWHLVLYRTPDRERVSFYANYSDTVPDSSGSLFFFQNHDTFLRAQNWCSTLLTITYFSPAQRGYGAR